MFLHFINKLSEELSIESSKQSSSHLESFLPVVVSVVFYCPAECTLEESVYHVADKVSLLQGTVVASRDMRQEIFL